MLVIGSHHEYQFDCQMGESVAGYVRLVGGVSAVMKGRDAVILLRLGARPAEKT